MVIRKNVGKDGWAFRVCAGLGACLLVAAACAGGDTPPRDDVLEQKILKMYDPDFETGAAGSTSMTGSGGSGTGGSTQAGGVGGSGTAGRGGAAGSGSVSAAGSGSMSSAGSGSSGSGSTGAVCDALNTVLGGPDGGRCGLGGCHDATSKFGNFASSEAAARALVDVATKSNVGCGVYIDSANPADSVILTKLSANPPCGAQMPFGSKPLAQADIDCVKSWLTQF